MPIGAQSMPRSVVERRDSVITSFAAAPTRTEKNAIILFPAPSSAVFKTVSGPISNIPGESNAKKGVASIALPSSNIKSNA